MWLGATADRAHPQQQLPPQRCTGGGQHGRQAGIALQQRNGPLAGHHRGIGIASLQKAEAMALIEAERLSVQAPQLLGQARIIEGVGAGAGEIQLAQRQINQDARAGGQHQPLLQAGIEQQRPAFTAATQQIRAVAQQDHPGAESPGERQRRCRSRCKQAARRLGDGIEQGQ